MSAKGLLEAIAILSWLVVAVGLRCVRPSSIAYITSFAMVSLFVAVPLLLNRDRSPHPCATSKCADQLTDITSPNLTAIGRVIFDFFALLQLGQVIAYAISFTFKSSNTSDVVLRTLAIVHTVLFIGLMIFRDRTPWSFSLGDDTGMSEGFPMLSIILLWPITCCYFVLGKLDCGSQRNNFAA